MRSLSNLVLMSMTGMTLDQESLRRKNEEIIQAYREKSRKQLQTQELYDKLKRRSMLGQVQNAASEAVDHTIQASVAANRYVDKVGNQSMRPPPPPLYPGIQSNDLHQPISNPNVAPRNETGDDAWAGASSQGRVNRMDQPVLIVFPDQSNVSAENQPMQTPSSHRQRVSSGNAPPRPGPIHPQMNNATETPLLGQRGIPRRSPLRNFNGNGVNGFAGYGMSAGLKVSNPTETVADGFSRPMIRSRGQYLQSPVIIKSLFSFSGTKTWLWPSAKSSIWTRCTSQQFVFQPRWLLLTGHSCYTFVTIKLIFSKANQNNVEIYCFEGITRRVLE